MPDRGFLLGGQIPCQVWDSKQRPARDPVGAERYERGGMAIECLPGVFERLFVVRAGSSPEGEAKAVKSARGMALHQLQSLVWPDDPRASCVHGLTRCNCYGAHRNRRTRPRKRNAKKPGNQGPGPAAAAVGRPGKNRCYNRSSGLRPATGVTGSTVSPEPSTGSRSTCVMQHAAAGIAVVLTSFALCPC